MKKAIAFILSIIMLLSFMPITTYAKITNEESYEEIELFEQEELRETNSKTFLTSEGTYVSIMTTDPICFEKDGKYYEIDNSIDQKSKNKLSNKNNIYAIELPKTYKTGDSLSLSSDNYTISLAIKNKINKSRSKVIKNKKEKSRVNSLDDQLVEESNLDKTTGYVTYNDIMDDINLEYQITPTTLKEDFILNATPNEDFSIEYTLSTGKLNAALNDDNSISLTDKNKLIFTINSPVMFDSNESSNNIEVKLSKDSKGKYSLVYTPNYTWLSDNKRIYPITIDPDITTETVKGSTSITDTYVSSTATTTKYNTSANLYVQNKYIYNQTNTKTIRESYFQINSLPELPDGLMLSNASFGIYKSQTGGNDSNNTLDISILNTDSNISTLTYNTRKNISSNAYKLLDTEYCGSSTGYLYFNVTEAIKKWKEENTTNKVLCVSGNSTTSTSLKFASTEYSNSNCRPILTIEYAAKKGLNDFDKYHSIDLGYAGTAYINDATGALSLRTYDFDYDSVGSNCSFTLDINKNQIDNNNFCNASISLFETFIADTNGNYKQVLSDGAVNYYCPYNGHFQDIQTHSLFNIHTNGTRTILEKLDENSNCIETKEYEEDQLVSYTTRTPSGKQNITNITYLSDENNKYINTISDSTGSTYIFFRQDDLDNIESLNFYSDTDNSNQLSTNGPVTGIYFTNTSDSNIYENSSGNDSSVMLLLSYDNNNRLNKISTTSQISEIFDNNNEIEIKYDNDNNISEVKNENGKVTQFNYDTLGRVESINELIIDEDSNEEIASRNMYSYEYEDLSTIISDSKGNRITEFFNKNGNLLSIKNTDGSVEFTNALDKNTTAKASIPLKHSQNYIINGNFESKKDCCFEIEDSICELNDDSYTGKYSLNVSVPSQEDYILNSSLTVDTLNSTYTLSFWAKTDNNNNNTVNLYISDNPDCQIEEDSHVQTFSLTTEWTQYSFSFNNNTSKQINYALGIQGNVYIDDLKLEKSCQASSHNLVNDGEFSNAISNWATFSNNISKTTLESSAEACDNGVLLINNSIYDNRSLGQCITLPISNDNASSQTEKIKYTIGGFSKNDGTLPSSPKRDREISMSVYASSSPISNENYLQSELVSKTEFMLQNSNWQYMADEFELSQNQKYVYILLQSNHEDGQTYFDGISLYQEPLYTIDYVNDEDCSYLESNNSITKSEKPTIPTNYSNIDRRLTIEGSEANENFDIYVKEKVSNSNPNEKYVSYCMNDLLDDVIWGEFDDIGRLNVYVYNYCKDIFGIKDGRDDIKYKYYWDEHHNLIGKESATHSINSIVYKYNGSLIESINSLDSNISIYNSTEENLKPIISFEYDMWGNLSSILYGEDDVIGFIYNDRAELTDINYPDGSLIELSYDKHGNLIHILGTPGNVCICSSDCSCCTCLNTENDEQCNCEECDSCSERYKNQFIDMKYFYYDNNEKYASYDLINNKIINYQNGLTTEYDALDHTIYHSFGTNSENETLELSNGIYTKSYNKPISNVQNQIVNSTEFYSMYEDSETDNANNIKTKIVDTYDDFGRLSNRDFYSPSDEIIMHSTYSYYNSETDNNILNGNDIYSVNNILGGLEDESDTIFQSDLIRSISYYNSNNNILFEYRYVYDNEGNIVSLSKVKPTSNGNDELLENYMYKYNNKNELIQESNIINTNLTNNSAITALFDYSYDNYGNLTNVTKRRITIPESNTPLYSNTLTYTGNDYSRKLSLFSERNLSDSITKNIEYNSNGSIVEFGDNIYKYSANNLLTFAKSQNQVIDYKYNSRGKLEYKSCTSTINSQSTNDFYNYYWRDNLLTSLYVEKSTLTDQEPSVESYNIAITYDLNDNPCGFLYIDSTGNAEPFYYITDATNCILGVVNSEGEIVITYKYNAWGTMESNKIDNSYDEINPLAYKSNLYDKDLNLYYENNRFYSPDLYRFISINPSIITSSINTTASNIYTYCENNPINKHSNWGTDATYDYATLNNQLFNKDTIRIPTIY